MKGTNQLPKVIGGQSQAIQDRNPTNWSSKSASYILGNQLRAVVLFHPSKTCSPLTRLLVGMSSNAFSFGDVS